MKYLAFIAAAIVLSGSCSRPPSRLEQALALAGENRGELEKVLAHYSADPADSLKYRAARFLIENMAIHYYYRQNPEYYDVMDSLNQSDLSKEEVYIRFDSIKSAIPVSPPAVFRDLETLSSGFLIQHIDGSFENRAKSPWKEKVSFGDFCEYILPYAVSHEKRELWTDYYRNRYLSYISQDLSGMNMADICEQLNDSLITFHKMRLNTGGMENYPPLAVDRIRSGTCGNYAARAIYLMRSLALPVSLDYTPQWGDYSASHSWNTIRSDDGKHLPFGGFDGRIKSWHISTRFNCAKVFRITYRIQENSLAAQTLHEPIPGFLNQTNLMDVTSEYIPVSDVTLPVKKPDHIKSKTAYLCVFNNVTWMAVHGGRTDGKKVTFTDMGRNVVYLPAFYDGEKFMAANNPFFLDSSGIVMPIKPNMEKKETLVLTRKYHLRAVRTYEDRMINGRFQGASQSDFSDCKDLYVIEQRPKMIFHTTDIATDHAYRYIRYIGEAGSFCNVAELEFYSEANGEYRKLSGQVIGTESAVYSSRKEVVFDGNILSYFEAATDSGGWVGLDLGRKERIARIRYLPRNDDNNIRPGDLYELFYWDDGTWHSLGQKTGDEKMELIYEDCPAGALYWLRNHTRGKEERIFTYENGEQIWW
jgi:hypothetical protein